MAVALLVGVGVLVSSGDTSSTTRNAALVVATPCTKPGQVTKVSKQSVVCATTNTGSLWYATMKAKGKAQACTKPGAIREKSKFVWVCGVIKKKKLWQATRPLSALAAKGDLPSTTPATPDAPIVADNAVLADPAVIDTAATQTLAPAVPATLSLVTQPLGGANAVALETQPVVQLLDQRGASISTAGITITAVSGRTDVVLSGNTAVTDATGRAIFKTLSLTGIMGDITLTFTASGLEGITSDKFVLAAGAATQLVISSTTGSVVSGKAFDQQPVLHFEDSSANVIAASGTDVIVTSSSQGLSGATTVATNKKGIAGFTDLALTQAGATTLTFTSGELSTTTEVTVVAGDYTTVKITTEASQGATNNTAFSQSSVVQLIDANNNNVTTAGITVTATITQFPTGASDTNSTLLISTATTDAQGVATFTGLGIKGLIGTYKLGFTPTNGVTQASEKTTTLSAGMATQLTVRTAAADPVGDDAAGTWSLTQFPVIGLRDISNNPVTTSGVTVTAKVDNQTQTYAASTNAEGEATIQLIFSGDSAGKRTIRYNTSRMEVRSDITLPILTPVLQAWVLPTDKTTMSGAFTLAPPTSNSNALWVFSGSGGAIATLEFFSGKVTPLGVAGTVTIRAAQPATTKYRSAELSANLVIALTPTVVSPAWVLPTGKTTTSAAFTLTAPTSNSNGAWTYTSSDATKATVSNPGGSVTPQGVAGTVAITATQTATTKFASTTTTANLVIALTPTVVSAAWVLPTGKTTTSAAFTLTAPTSNSNGAWTYASSDATKATVSSPGGSVTTKGVAGTVTITATQTATTKFASTTTTANLVIALTPTVVSAAWVLPTGKTTTSPEFTLTAPTSNSNGAWTYASSNAAIAVIGLGATGEEVVRLSQGVAGTVTITATQAATTKFASTTTTANLVIALTPTVVSPAWALQKRYKSSPAFTLTAPTSNSNGAWTYASSNATIATVTTAGIVTTKGVAGTVTITATQAATTKYASGSTSASIVTTNDYNVGDLAPGGGTVFYDAGTPQSWGRYLVAAATDYFAATNSTPYPTEVQWGCYNTADVRSSIVTGATDTAFGTGRANTGKILAACKETGIAADVARKYSTTNTAGAPGAAGQWFLPSRDELNELCKIYSNGRTDTGLYASSQDGCTGSGNPTGGFSQYFCYWSSSETGGWTAYKQSFYWGDYINGAVKYIPCAVRPVRVL